LYIIILELKIFKDLEEQLNF